MTLTAQKIWQMPLLLLTLWLGGCAMQYDEEPPFIAPNDLYLVVDVHTGDRNVKATRAEKKNEVTFQPTIIDREKINTLRIIVVKKSTGLIVDNDPRDLTAEPATFVKGLKYPVQYDTDYDVYLIGNEEGLKLSDEDKATLASLIPGRTYNGNALETMTMQATASGNPLIASSDNANVPMTEIFTVHTKTKEQAEAEQKPDNEGVIQNETFFITRAASKFSFYFLRQGVSIGEADSRVINSVTITGLGKDKYIFPNNTQYSPDKDDDRTSIERDITSFSLPCDNDVSLVRQHGEYEFNLPGDGFKVSDLPERTSDNTESIINGLSQGQLDACSFIPAMYFPESKGNEDKEFYCSIKVDGRDYGVPVVLNNLPYGLPRNTHVVVIVTIKDLEIEANVHVIPFSVVDLKPDFGLEREETTGFIIGKDDQNRLCWWDDSGHDGLEGPYYLGPDKTVTNGNNVSLIDGKYMLVYADGDDYTKPCFEEHLYDWSEGAPDDHLKRDENGNFEYGPQVSRYEQISGYERKASTLYMIIDKESNKRYILTPEGITGYEAVKETGQEWLVFYLNRAKQRVWIDSNQLLNFSDNPDANNNLKDNPHANGTYMSHRIVFEWDRLDWNGVCWDRNKGIYPRAWFDVFGERYLWDEDSNTKEKRDDLLRKKYGNIVNYLEDRP